MNKHEIRTQARERMEKIESIFMDAHVPPEIMSLYMLLKLISYAKLEDYFLEFGLQEVQPSDVNEAKISLGWGSINSFEVETCALLREAIQRTEAARPKRHVLGLRPNSNNLHTIR